MSANGKHGGWSPFAVLLLAIAAAYVGWVSGYQHGRDEAMSLVNAQASDPSTHLDVGPGDAAFFQEADQ